MQEQAQKLVESFPLAIPLPNLTAAAWPVLERALGWIRSATDGEMPHRNIRAGDSKGGVWPASLEATTSPAAREAEFRRAYPEAALLIDEHNQLDVILFKSVQDTFEKRWRPLMVS